MSVLVTGASGFLGGRLAAMLIGTGEEVTVLARERADLRHFESLPKAQLRVVRGGLTDSGPVAEAVRDATHIFHCAATSTDWERDEVYFRSNVQGTETLLRAAEQSAPKLKRFVHVSTTDVYGYPMVPCAETAPLRDVGLPYNRTKILAEKAVWAAAKAGLPVSVVRPATIYGPRGKAFVTDIAELLRTRLMAHVAGGHAAGGFIYVDNAAEAMIAVAESAQTLGEAYNLSDGTGVSWRAYAEALADGLGYKRPWIDLPYVVAIALARTMEAPWKLRKSLPGRPLLTQHAVVLLARDQEFPIAKAQTAFGFAPRIGFDEGMGRSVAWVKEQAAV